MTTPQRCPHGQVIHTDVDFAFAGAIYYCVCCRNEYGSLNNEPADQRCPHCRAEVPPPTLGVAVSEDINFSERLG